MLLLLHIQEKQILCFSFQLIQFNNNFIQSWKIKSDQEKLFFSQFQSETKIRYVVLWFQTLLEPWRSSVTFALNCLNQFFVYESVWSKYNLTWCWEPIPVRYYPPCDFSLNESMVFWSSSGPLELMLTE